MSSFFKFPTTSPFKGHNPIKGFNNTIRNISEYVSTPGSSSIKALRSALLEGDETKALEIYLTVVKGHSLQSDLQVSAPFPLQRYADQTPLHLAALSALPDVISKFLDFGGNPGTTNARGQTSLHSICSKEDKPEIREELLMRFIDWRGPEIDGAVDLVSMNHVDADGNAA